MSRYLKNEKVLILVILAILIISGFQVSAIVAHVNVRPTEGQAPLAVFFSDASEGKPSDWRWDFGDGYTGEGQQIMHTYFQPGVYTVKMTVTDESGATDTKILTDAIQVANNPYFSPIPTIPQIIPSFMADFKVNKKTGSAPFQVQFTDLSTGDPSSWKWDFGDGTGDSVQNPVHVYAQPGTYSVLLTIAKDSSVSTKKQTNNILVTTGQASASMATQPIAGHAQTQIPNSTPSLTISQEPAQVSTTQTHEVQTEDRTITPSQEISTIPIIPRSLPPGEMYPIIPNPLVNFYNKTESLISLPEMPGSEDLLRISNSPAVLAAGTIFSSEIKGIPGEDVYFWIVIPGDIMNLKNPEVPHLVPNQNDIAVDDPSGPYRIGGFIPSEEGQNLSLRSLIPIDPAYQGTAYYGLGHLNQTGNMIAVWNTTLSIPGKYFIRAESKGPDSISSATLRKAAASVEIT